MRVRDYIGNELWEIIYAIVTIVYLSRLNALNKELLSCNFSGPVELLEYNDFIAVKFFGIAAVLFVIGCILIRRGLRKFKLEEYSLSELMISLLAVVIIFVLLILLILYIDNPILKAILIVGLMIYGAASAAN